MSHASQYPFARRGFCLILSSPSGAGKTTLARRLLAADQTLSHSISVTTRPRRPQEQDGVDYFFVSRDHFEQMRAQGALLESAEVFGNLYGTPAEPVKEALGKGQDIVFDVDWQGSAAISELLPSDTVRVFILPPTAGELARRIYARASDPEDVIRRRLQAAMEEMSHWDEYDYVIVNHDIEESLAMLSAIVTAERLKRHRQGGIGGFVGGLAPDIMRDGENGSRSSSGPGR